MRTRANIGASTPGRDHLLGNGVWLALGLGAVLLASCAAPQAPSPHLVGALNPDVTQATIHQTVCKTGWTATIRPSKSYTEALKRKQLPKGAKPAGYEEDHLMPLELGGSPRDPANLKPIPIVRAKADDKVEGRLHRELCAGSITLAQAQQQISQQKAGE